MRLTDQQTQQFRQHGYVMLERFYSDREVAAMRAEIDRFKREGLLRNVTTDGDGKTHSNKSANLQLCPMYAHSTLFRALPFDDKVIASVEQLIGSPIFLHLDQVFLKPGKHGQGTNWHQDNAYFKIPDPLRGTAMWIAVHDATVANGTLHVLPDMFNEQLEHSRDPYSDHHIRCYPPEQLEAKAVPMELKAGGVAFFCYGTPHCTRANTTDRERAGVAYHFLHESVAGKSTHGEAITKEDRTYHPCLSGAKSTGGEREYGIKVAGTWDAEVDKALAQGEPAAAR